MLSLNDSVEASQTSKDFSYFYPELHFEILLHILGKVVVLFDN